MIRLDSEADSYSLDGRSFYSEECRLLHGNELQEL